MQVVKIEVKQLEADDCTWPEQIESVPSRPLPGITWPRICLANQIDEQLIKAGPISLVACTSSYHLEKKVALLTTGQEEKDDMKRTSWQTQIDCQGRYLVTDLWGPLAQQSVCEEHFVRKLVESKKVNKERIAEFSAVFPTSPTRQLLLMCLVAMLRLCGKKPFPDAGWNLQYHVSRVMKCMPGLTLDWFCPPQKTSSLSVYYSSLLGATDYTIEFTKPTLAWSGHECGIQLLAASTAQYTSSTSIDFYSPMFLTAGCTFVLPFCSRLPSLFCAALDEAQEKKKIQFTTSVDNNEAGPTRACVSGMNNNLLLVRIYPQNNGISLHVVHRDAYESTPIENWLPLTISLIK